MCMRIFFNVTGCSTKPATSTVGCQCEIWKDDPKEIKLGTPMEEDTPTEIDDPDYNPGSKKVIKDLGMIRYYLKSSIHIFCPLQSWGSWQSKVLHMNLGRV